MARQSTADRATRPQVDGLTFRTEGPLKWPMQGVGGDSRAPRGLFDNVEAELSMVVRAERQAIGVDRHRKGWTERPHTTDPGIQTRNLAQLPGLDVDEIDVGEADTSELERPMAHGLPAATRWFLADRA